MWLVAVPALAGPLLTALPNGGPDLWSYGYLQADRADLDRVPLHALSHVALFAAGVDEAGALQGTSAWELAPELVARAAPRGVRVHLAVACFDERTLTRLLGRSSARTSLVVGLRRWLALTGAHGVNLDFEAVPRSRKAELLTLVRELEAAVDDVVVAVPAVDHRGAWDLQGLSRHADLYVMAYDYHWAGSSHAGPVDPLRAGPGTVWEDVNPWSITRTIDDVLAAGADPAHLVLGLPLYGREWPVTGDRIPAPTTGRGRAVPFDVAWERARDLPTRLEPDSTSRVLFEQGRQLWFGDTETVRRRIREVRDHTTWAGVGFWSVDQLSDPAFWRSVDRERRVTSVRGHSEVRDLARTWLPRAIAGAGVLLLLARLLGAISTLWVRWYSGRRGEMR